MYDAVRDDSIEIDRSRTVALPEEIAEGSKTPDKPLDPVE
jgi:hypothetical protein